MPLFDDETPTCEIEPIGLALAGLRRTIERLVEESESLLQACVTDAVLSIGNPARGVRAELLAEMYGRARELGEAGHNIARTVLRARDGHHPLGYDLPRAKPP